jgi:hypothetical protein
MTRHSGTGAGAALAAAALLACGQGGASDRTVFDESEIVGYLHLRPDPNSTNWLTYTAPDGSTCEVVVVLTSQSDVQSYAGDAGVVTNPAKTAGVKVIDQRQETCLRLLSDALKGFPPK